MLPYHMNIDLNGDYYSILGNILLKSANWSKTRITKKRQRK